MAFEFKKRGKKGRFPVLQKNGGNFGFFQKFLNPSAVGGHKKSSKIAKNVEYNGKIPVSGARSL